MGCQRKATCCNAGKISLDNESLNCAFVTNLSSNCALATNLSALLNHGQLCEVKGDRCDINGCKKCKK